MAEGIVKPGHAVLEEGRECQHRDIRNHQHQESIVPERGSDVTVQKGVDNALRAATWTTQACELQENALGKQAAGFRIGCGVDI